MKKMKKILCFLLAFVLTFGCMSGTAFAIERGTRPADGVTEDQPFVSGTGGSAKFRIPCLVTLDDGTIVAGCDARWTTYRDGGGLDTIVSYSKDNGKTWNYTFANYLGDNGNVHNSGSTAFIDPAMATDGKTIWMIADLYPAGIALNGAYYWPLSGHTGYDKDGNLALTNDRSADTNGDGIVDVNVNGDVDQYGNAILNEQDIIANADYNYSLVKNPDENAESYYLIQDENGMTVEGYTVDAYFNIKGEDVDTNLFCADSPYRPYPTDFLYMTKSEDGGKTWSVPTLLDVKKESEQTLLVGPGRGMVTSEGRIIFTAYEFTSGDRNSAVIYSDDGGATWERGASVSGWSSEAVATEVDGKLYMFTRHGNCYYVSEDWGETWGNPVRVPKPYNDNCQLTAITYSKKIDGKTAILFAGPSNTGSRAAGKIYVGLVQEDTTIDWAYEYSINGDAYYAYSCLAELRDGSIGLLYENADTEITYINIPIEDIAKGAEVGNLWLTNSEGNVTTSLDMKSNETVELTVNGLEAGAEVAVESSNADALTVSYADNKVTITSGQVSGLSQVVVNVKSGDETATVNVDITDSENYEIVYLRMGDTKTYTDNTGNYGNGVVLENNVAKVTITDESDEVEKDNETVSAGMQAKLATAVATFDGASVDLSKCLYTFTKEEGEHNYIISNETADEKIVYLNHKASNNSANTENSAVITVAKHPSNATFSLYDNTDTGNSNGGYLWFWKSANASNGRHLHYDRNSSAADNCYFELYQQSDSATDSPIKGYAKVNNLTEITDGGKYLIVSQASDGAYYVLYPYSGGADFNHVAQVTEAEVKRVDAEAQLGSTAAYDGDVIPASDCLYMFTSTGDEDQYQISAKASDGTTVYLSLSGNSATTPNQTSAVNVKVTADKNVSNAFDLKDLSRNAHLHFHSDNLHFNRCGGDCSNDYVELYQQSDSAADSPIKGYAKVTELSEIKDGGKYLIARKGDDDKYYVMHPAYNAGNHDYVAKITGNEYVAPEKAGSTSIVIEAVGEGNTSVEVGGTAYYIIVKNEVKNITLEKGDRTVLPGTLQKQDNTQNVVEIKENTELAPYVAVDTIKSGEEYLIVSSTSSMLINRPSELTNPSGLAMAAGNYNKGEYSANMWTITAVDGGYTIQDINGQYLTFSGSSVVLSDTAQVLNIGNGASTGYGISYGGQYLNNYGKENNRAAGYSQNDNDWYFYQPAEGYVVTGVTAGNTVITVSGVNYHITVTEKVPELADYAKVNDAKAKVPADLSIYTEGSVKVLNEALEAVQPDMPKDQQSTVDGWAAAIEEAIKNLVDLSELKSVYDANKDKKADEYTAASWNTFAAAKTDAEKVIAKADATQDEVDEAAKALDEAAKALVLEKADDDEDKKDQDSDKNSGSSANTDSSNKGSSSSGTSTAPTTASPSTGDSANTVLYVGIMAAMAVVLMYLKKRYFVTK